MAGAIFRDAFHDSKRTSLKHSINITASYDSTAIGVAGYEGLLITCDLGVSGDTLSTTNYGTISLIECATSGGSYSAVADADVICTTGVNAHLVQLAGDSTLYEIAYKGKQPFVKLRWVESGSLTSGVPQSVIAWQTCPRFAPATS